MKDATPDVGMSPRRESMANRVDTFRGGVSLIAIIAVATSLAAAVPAQAANVDRLLGGPKGAVKTDQGIALEGTGVQLISDKSAIRPTVYRNADGRYEFPKLESGSYTLRVALPREFQPYVKKPVQINGPTAFEDIALTRVTKLELLPPTREIMAQMTGSEWLSSLSGTGEEKKLLTQNCNFCHSYQQIFRNHYDEHGWTEIVQRMTHGAGSPLILQRPNGRFNDALEAQLVKWLATVRGANVEDPSFVMLPRPQGRATRVVITEYELPRLELATHDVGRRAGQHLVLDASQFLCRQARSQDGKGHGIPCA